MGPEEIVGLTFCFAMPPPWNVTALEKKDSPATGQGFRLSGATLAGLAAIVPDLIRPAEWVDAPAPNKNAPPATC